MKDKIQMQGASLIDEDENYYHPPQKTDQVKEKPDLINNPQQLESQKEENKTAVNLVSRIMGASVLSGSYVFRFLGLAQTIVVMLVTVVIYIFLTNYQIDAIYYSESKTFRELVRKLTGDKFSKFIDIIVVFQSLGTLTSYQVIASKALMNIVFKFTDTTLTFNQLKFIIRPLLGFGIIFPLTLLKNTKQLSMISPFSVCAISITVISVVFYFLMSFAHDNSICIYKVKGEAPLVLHNDYMMFPDKPVWKQALYFLKYIPTLQLTFSISAAHPIVYSDLKGPVQIKRKMYKVALALALAFSVLFFSMISFSGSFGFGSHTTDNIMDTFSPCGFIYMDVMSILYALVLLLAYPLVMQAPRVALLNLLHKTPDNYTAYVLVGFGFVLITCLMACVLEKIVAIFGLFSAFCGYFVYFLIPIMAAYQIPFLKKSSKLPSLRSQIKNEQISDNLLVTLVSILQIEKLTEVTRNIYQGKERSKSSVAVKPKRDSVISKLSKRSSSLVAAKRASTFDIEVEREQLNPKTQANLKRYDYSKEYPMENLKARKIVCMVVAGLFAVACAIAFVLNLMDFMKA
ncbi:Amino_acid transporter family protein [Hexamita inflata]|uniref:Amino acid transporter family protein n=1 Tax=Hexamita inflata TaxID=28002 RepID=A0AA86RLH6_9EUKA|nr:Amino acid transporter family protein [Hexamita inflata]